MSPGLPTLCQVETSFHFRPINDEEVVASLRNLNVHKATGVDGISHPIFFALLQLIQCPASQVYLMQASPVAMQIPAEWKKANVTQICSPELSLQFQPISVIPASTC